MNASGVPRKRGGRCLGARPESLDMRREASGARKMWAQAGRVRDPPYFLRATYLNLPLSQGSP